LHKKVAPQTNTERYFDCAALATSEEPAAQYYLRHAGAQTVSCAAGEDCGNKAYFLRKCAREQICRIEILWNEINAVLFLLHRSSEKRKHPSTHLQRPNDARTNAFFAFPARWQYFCYAICGSPAAENLLKACKKNC
jgi:hypothetical protein